MEEKYKFLSSQTIFRTFAFLVLINLLFLDSLLFKGQKTEIIEKTVSIPVVLNACPASCLSEISKATKGATLTIKSTSTPTPTPTVKPVSQTQTSSSVKEFFVPFGTGSSSSDDW